MIDVESEETWVYADAARVDQILTNLMSNAVKYTPAGGRITIRVQPRGDQGVFEIADTGVGMAPGCFPASSISSSRRIGHPTAAGEAWVSA